MRYILILLIGLSLVGFRTSKPPEFNDITPENVIQLNQALEALWNITNGRYSLNYVTSNPDGSLKGDVGDILLFNNSGTYYLEINVGGTVWKGVVLTDTP